MRRLLILRSLQVFLVMFSTFVAPIRGYSNAYYNTIPMLGKKSILRDSSLTYFYNFNTAGSAPANKAKAGTNHSLTLGSTASRVVDSQRGGVLDLNGASTGSATAVGNKGQLGSGDKTLSVWLRLRRSEGDYYGEENRILWWGLTGTAGKAFMLLLSGGTFIVSFGGGSTYTPVKPIFDWVWHHVVVAVRSGQAYFYIDGVQDGSYTIPSYDTTSGDDLSFGTSYNGRIDDFMIFNKGLVTAEVEQLFNLQKKTRAAECSSTAQCSDGNGCTTESCIAGICEFQPNASCNPQSCEDAVYAKGITATGNTTLYVAENPAKPFTATCTVEAVTKTYIPLASTSSSTGCSKTEHNSFCNYSSGTVSRYSKVAFSAETMAIYSRGDDGRYATTTGSGRVLYGTASGCACSSSETNLGKGHVYLVGTPFSMPAGNRWVQSGWQGFFNLSPSPSSQGVVDTHMQVYFLPATSTVSFSAGGCCGGSFPGNMVIPVTYP